MRIPERCTCSINFNWEDGPCDYCNGDYPCPGGCGELAADCECELFEEDNQDD